MVCPDAVTPVELATAPPEADIPLPISGTPAPGDFAIATSPNGRWAYVVTTDGVSPSHRSTGGTGTGDHRSGHHRTRPDRAERGDPRRPGHPAGGDPDRRPGHGRHPRHGGHARTGPPCWRPAASTVVPVDVATRQVGAPSTSGPATPSPAWRSTRPAPSSTSWCPTASSRSTPSTPRPGRPSPPDWPCRRCPRPTARGHRRRRHLLRRPARGGPTTAAGCSPSAPPPGPSGRRPSFDRFGIADPAALAVTPDGTSCWWPTRPTTGSTRSRWRPSPPRPPRCGCPADATGGTDHPTDIVIGPGGTTAYIVDGFDTVLPYSRSQTFGGHPGRARGLVDADGPGRRAGAASMTVARRSPSSGRPGRLPVTGRPAPAAPVRGRCSRPAAASSSSRARGMSAARCQSLGMVSGQEMIPQ